MIRALLVDDEAPARSELRYLLAGESGVQVVGEAAGAREALELARSLEPDVVFLDVELPGLSGVEAAWAAATPRRPTLTPASRTEIFIERPPSHDPARYKPGGAGSPPPRSNYSHGREGWSIG